MQAFRLGDAAGEHAVFHPAAGQDGGRWNSAGTPVLYAAPIFSTAMVEKLVHLPKTDGRFHQRYVVIDIPDDLDHERVGRDEIAGWKDPDSPLAKRYGDLWIVEQRTPLLYVPSVVSPFDDNLLINLHHPDAWRIEPSEEYEYEWDARLFG